LVHVEEFADNFLGDVVLHVHHRCFHCLVERQRTSSSGLRMPAAKMRLHAIAKLKELLG
jgi:hypothetical protein